MRPPLRCYPRKTVRIAIEHLLRNATAIANRAERDKIIILRGGKPHRVIMRYDYFARLEALAGKNGLSANKCRGSLAQRRGRTSSRKPI